MLKKILVPFGTFSAIILATYFHVNFEIYIILFIALLISLIIFSPFEIISERLAPKSRVMISLSLVMFLSVFIRIRNIQAVVLIVSAAIVLIGLVIKFNGQLMQNYKFLITERQQIAISNREELKCFSSWNSKGKRECDTFLREYMSMSIANEDLEKIARPSYLIGFLTAQNKFEHEDYEELQEALKTANKRLKNYKNDYSALNELQEQTLQELNQKNDTIYRLERELREVELLQKLKSEKEAKKESLADTDSMILELKSKEPSLSLSQIAERANSTKSHVQYVLRKA